MEEVTNETRSSRSDFRIEGHLRVEIKVDEASGK